MKVNLGSSDDLRHGYLNVDKTAPPFIPPGIDFAIWDLARRWPPEDSTVEELVAKDVFEHIDSPEFPGQKGIIWVMNESHRVLRAGGILKLTVPSLPGVAPWVDPTHVSVWTADLRYYFTEPFNNPADERGRLGPAYRITALFRTVGGRSGVEWTPIRYGPAPDRCKIFVDLEAVK